MQPSGFRRAALCALALVVAGACNAMTMSDEPVVVPLASLVGSSWVLVEGPAAIPDGVEVTLTIEADRLAGYAGCNRFFASVASHVPGEMTVGPAGSTRMMCPPPRMELESAVLQAIGAAERYEYGPEGLVLDGDESPGPLRFAPAG